MRFFVVFLFVLLIPVIGVAMMFQTTPQVVTSASEQVDQADTVKHLLEQLSRTVQERHQSHTLTITEQQFASMVGLIQRARPEIKGVVDVQPQYSTAKLTIALPDPMQGWYINVEAKLLPSEELDFDYIRIGNLTLPGGVAVATLTFFIDQYTRSDIASTAVANVSDIKMREDELTISMKPLDTLLKEAKAASTNIGGERDYELEAMTAYYLAYLDDHAISQSQTPISVAQYLNVAMTRAAARSNPESAYRHNQAVILALAAYVGHHRISPLIGDIQPDPLRPLKPNAPAVMANRNDLARHFILSAAIQLLSEKGVSLAIGEFKELMDRAIGGSGYSFVDLAADMAGMEFAQVAMDPRYASDVQRILASNHAERTLFPSIVGLPEGLSKAEFQRQYTTVDSPAYLSQVDEIQTRLNKVTLYQRFANSNEHNGD